MYMRITEFRRKRPSGALPRTGMMRRGMKIVRAGANGYRRKIADASTACSHGGEKHVNAMITTMRNACSTTCEKSWSATRSHTKCDSKKSHRDETAIKVRPSILSGTDQGARTSTIIL